MLPELLSVDFVAEYLGIRVKTVHEFVREGKLGCVQIGPRDRKFTMEQVEAFIHARTVTPPPSRIDNPARKKLRSPKRGGDEGSKLSGDDVRARLREEMRSWR